MKVRPAKFSDSKEIVEIWNPYIKNTFVTFNSSEKTQEDAVSYTHLTLPTTPYV